MKRALNHRARFRARRESRAFVRAELGRPAKPGSGYARRLFAHGRLVGRALALTLWIIGDAFAGPPEEPSPADVAALRREVAALRKELAEQRARYEERLAALESLVARVEAQQAAALPGEAESEDELESLIREIDAGDTAAGQEPGFAGSLGRAIQSFNPDVSINVDFVGHYSSNEGQEFDDEFLVREVELGFTAPIDPYTRADVFIGAHPHDGDWHVHVEEAYLTYLGMPGDLQPRIGRFKPTFGKANPVHVHALPWSEYPLVIQNYFGEEGLMGDGAGLSWLVPNPWDRFVELTYEVINNDSSLFAGEETDDFVHLFHLKYFHDLSEASTLEAGLSFATAPNDEGHGGNRTMVEGLDLTLKWRPPEEGRYKSFLWQTELLAAQADLCGGQESTWGMYTAADYQFARRWVFGTRYDYSQMPYSSSLHEHGLSAYLTFLQSEYLYWRLGYMYTDRNFRIHGDKQENEVFLQCNFSLGPHPAHEY